MTKTMAHPPASEMVPKAIEDLKDKKGSSLQAIRRYIKNYYDVNAHYLSTYVRIYMLKAIEGKIIMVVSGRGLSGRFRMNPGAGKKAGRKAPAAAKVKKAATMTAKPKAKTVAKKAPAVSAPAKEEAKLRGPPKDRSVAQKKRKETCCQESYETSCR